MGEEAEALPGLSGVNLELHTGTPPHPTRLALKMARGGSLERWGGAPQVLERDCVRALIDKVDRKQGATEAQRSKKRGKSRGVRGLADATPIPKSRVGKVGFDQNRHFCPR